MPCLVRSSGMECFRLVYSKPSKWRDEEYDVSCKRKLREKEAKGARDLGHLAFLPG